MAKRNLIDEKQMKWTCYARLAKYVFDSHGKAEINDVVFEMSSYIGAITGDYPDKVQSEILRRIENMTAIEALSNDINDLKNDVREYRWEFEDIGQGHYFSGLWACLEDAYRASRQNTVSVIKVEIFKPERATIVRVQNGEEI